MKPLAALVLVLASLLALATLYGVRPTATVYADEWTEYPGPELPEYDSAPTPPPPPGMPSMRIYGRTIINGDIEVVVTLTNPPLPPLPGWADPIVSWIDVAHDGQRQTITVNDLLDTPYRLTRDNIPGCTPERYCLVRITAFALVPTGDGRYDMIASDNFLEVLLPPSH